VLRGVRADPTGIRRAQWRQPPPGQSAETSENVAADVVASRVRRLVPGAPPALQKELHSIARDITVLAKYAAPNRVPSAVKVEISAKRPRPSC
jgi:hypothetical protein